MRLDFRFRRALHATLAALFVTGAVWVVADRMGWRLDPGPWQKAAAWLLMLHGGAAMVMLVLLGALIPFHVRVAWRRRENRATGVVMLAVNFALIVTAFGLYYLGSESLRRVASDAHVLVGLALPLLLIGHLKIGRVVVREKRLRAIARTARRVADESQADEAANLE